MERVTGDLYDWNHKVLTKVLLVNIPREVVKRSKEGYAKANICKNILEEELKTREEK